MFACTYVYMYVYACWACVHACTVHVRRVHACVYARARRHARTRIPVRTNPIHDVCTCVRAGKQPAA